MEIKFIEDLEKDTNNWQGSMVGGSNYGLDWWKFLPRDILVEKTKDPAYLRNYLEGKYYKTGKIAEFITWLEQNINSAQIQEDLELLMNKKFGNITITVFITVFGRGMYHVPGSLFYLNYCHRDPEKSASRIYHELMHFLFHIYYWEECQKAGFTQPQIHDLKESLTVLLNPILDKRGLPLDQGYPKHKELRTKLKELWGKKSWKFEDFLKEVLTRKWFII
ncbi:MAG TPA: hypothetical protein P5524_01515 [Candidatus Paceibacterota bacterium]|nr:hypothetical protein [Candidatus Paceibacterota bacterium]